MSLEELRAFLVRVPGIPATLTDQLGGDALAAGTLPIPVPAGMGRGLQGTDTTVGDRRAVAMAAGDLAHAIVWQDSSRLMAVAGTYDEGTVRSLAERIASR